jgi:NADH:ubiquinone oxidoreductase subunit F (NADH-binding)
LVPVTGPLIPMTSEWSSGLSIGAFPGAEPRLLKLGGGEREAYETYVRGNGFARGGAEGPELIDAIESAGLRGRGGAAFPTGVKLRSVHDRAAPRYIVANGEEAEPASVKDRWLLRHRPHLVLDGLLRTAEAVGVERAYVFVSDSAAAKSVAQAIDELGSTTVPIELATVAAAYVAGEETAVIRAIGGGPALPLDKPPRPFERGVDGRPTLVANIETLANVPGIALRGPGWFRSLGTTASPGTFLLTVSGACEHPGLYEVPFGVTLHEALSELAGLSDAPCGFLMGGFFGGVLGPRALDVRLAYDEFRDEGSGLGCGAVIVLGADDCPVAAAADVMAYFERENAKQCGACIRGTQGMRDVLFQLGRGSSEPGQVDRLRGWSTSLRERGACALLDGAASLVGSLLREFPETVEEHLGARCDRCAVLLPTEDAVRSRFLLTV